MGLYNSTGLGSYGLGCGLDLERVRKEREKIETPIVCLARQFMATTGEKLYEINPQSFWLCIPHSENGVITKRAIEGMTGGQQEILQKILHVFAVGPAESLARNQGFSIKNAYSNRDYITGFGPLGYAKRFMDNSNYDIQVLPCISSRSDKHCWVADHGFLQPTYRRAWEDHISYLKDKLEFYQGVSSDQAR